MLSLPGHAVYKNRKCECESGAEKETRVLALALTLALFCTPNGQKLQQDC